MTLLHKPVRRVSELSVVRDAGKYRPLAVTLYPNGTIGLRPAGTRREEITTIEAVYSLAIKQRVAKEQAQKKADKKAKRKS